MSNSKYFIWNLDSNLQRYIAENNIDKNGNRFIDKDNGELAELLSNSNIKEITSPRSYNVGGFFATALWLGTYRALKDIGNPFFENMKYNKILSAAEVVFVAAVGLFLGSSSYTQLKMIDNEEVENKPQEETHTFQRNKYETQYRQVFGEDAELKEYTPQKGEYWTSILKAKYGVDEAVALRMTHKIKDIIYEDSLVAKQSPVMYLPETWTFEGKTYHYDEKAAVETTDNYSEEIKTEMGKMSKDIKYE